MQRIKNFIKSHETLYGAGVFIKNFPREVRSFFLPLMAYDANAYSGSVAFQGDVRLQEMVKRIFANLQLSAVIETGTYRGDTTVFLARNFSGPIYTCENIGLYYREDKHRFIPHPNITILKGSSAETLRVLADGGKFGELPFFFLDAHWYDYWPLLDELAVIKEKGKAVIVIHDFLVPGKPHFGFDVYEDRKAGVTLKTDLDFIKGFLDPKRHRILFPAYGIQQDQLRGHIIIFQDLDRDIDRIVDNKDYTEYKL